MPLIVISGVPCSGKTTRANELKEYFQQEGTDVEVVNEYEQILKAGFDKNSFYFDSSKEKHIRGLLKSQVLRLIKPETVVILDAPNYIKGYRYELYCGAKSNKCTQCTIHAEINRDMAWEFNNKRNEEERYTRETFDALLMRYEEPDSKNRWDAPLFLIFPDQALDKQAIKDSLFNKKAPKPNMSTQNPPLSSTNFLYDLDRVTKDITDKIVKARSAGATGEFEIPGYNGLTLDITKATNHKLMLLRRQYLTYSKMHVPNTNQIPQLYIQYLQISLI